MTSYFSITTAPNDDILEQLEALRQEVRMLGSSISGLRQDDLRKVFGEQIRSVLKERIERFFYEKSASPDSSEELKDIKAELNDLVDDTISIFQKYGKSRAIARLDEFEPRVHGLNLLAETPELPRFVFDLVQQVRSYLNTSDTVLHPKIDHLEGLSQSQTPTKGAVFSLPLAEELLSPLANSWRLGLLTLLTKEDEGLAGLSRSMGLKKGHLQFHLNSLLESGYVRYDKKSHLYSITKKGETALDGVAKLIDSLASV